MIEEYTSIEELKAYSSTLSHEGLNELYQTVRKHEGRIFVRETRLYENKFNWRNPFKPTRKEIILYEMLWTSMGTVQIIHATYKAEAVETFLLGFIYGASSSMEQCSKTKEETK